jgi:hypothetical protein
MFGSSGLNFAIKNTTYRCSNYHYAILSAWAHSYKDEPIYGDNSGPLFAIYSKSVEKSDNAMCERWQKDADGMIIFVRVKLTISTTPY